MHSVPSTCSVFQSLGRLPCGDGRRHASCQLPLPLFFLVLPCALITRKSKVSVVAEASSMSAAGVPIVEDFVYPPLHHFGNTNVFLRLRHSEGS
jgi:hypothetical protein